jgi:CRP/FNR family cyclic AMP-dependent transcriptional regulator
MTDQVQLPAVSPEPGPGAGAPFPAGPPPAVGVAPAQAGAEATRAEPAAGAGTPLVDIEAALKSPVFKGLSSEQIREFVAIGTPRHFKAGEVLIQEGDSDTDMYLLLRGKLDILKRVPPVVPGGTEQQKSLFQPVVPQMMGVFPVGHVNMVAGGKRTATVVALEDCDTLMITREAFDALAERDPRLGYIITRNIAADLANTVGRTNEQVQKLTTALTLALQRRG